MALLVQPCPNRRYVAKRPLALVRRWRAFTVLELMIAMALLVGLLAVAWSILGSYRMAEQRGWDQAYRMQTVRTARELLESDAAHWRDFSSSAAFDADPQLDALSAAFVGDEDGFSIVVLPSRDPLPWLEEITAAAESDSVQGPYQQAGTQATVPGERGAERVAGPLTRVRLRYAIVRNESSTAATTLAHLRRQMTPLNQAPESSADEASAADRVLTIDDLYRRNETEKSEGSRATETILVRNLISPRFRYSDGSAWHAQWDGHEQGGLPRAIELTFDHPRANNPYRVSAEPEPGQGLAVPADSEAEVRMDGAEATGATPDRDVRIVVHVPDGIPLDLSSSR